MNLSAPEPPPTGNASPSVQGMVRRDLAAFRRPGARHAAADMADREAVGVAKYGVPLQAGNGRDALIDAYQEALDLAAYLRQAIAEGGEIGGTYRRALELVCELRWLIALRDTATEGAR